MISRLSVFCGLLLMALSANCSTSSTLETRYSWQLTSPLPSQVQTEKQDRERKLVVHLNRNLGATQSKPTDKVMVDCEGNQLALLPGFTLECVIPQGHSATIFIQPENFKNGALGNYSFFG